MSTNLNTRKKALGITSASLGAAVGINPCTIRAYLSGQCRTPADVEKKINALFTKLEKHKSKGVNNERKS
jgi:hypothetical protein